MRVEESLPKWQSGQMGERPGRKKWVFSVQAFVFPSKLSLLSYELWYSTKFHDSLNYIKLLRNASNRNVCSKRTKNLKQLSRPCWYRIDDMKIGYQGYASRAHCICGCYAFQRHGFVEKSIDLALGFSVCTHEMTAAMLDNISSSRQQQYQWQ